MFAMRSKLEVWNSSYKAIQKFYLLVRKAVKTKEDDIFRSSSFVFTKYFLLPPPQLIFQDHRHDNTHNGHNQSTEERVPPNGVIDDQAQPESLANNTR